MLGTMFPETTDTVVVEWDAVAYWATPYRSGEALGTAVAFVDKGRPVFALMDAGFSIHGYNPHSFGYHVTQLQPFTAYLNVAMDTTTAD